MTTAVAIPFHTGNLAGILETPDNSTAPLVVLLHGFTGWKEEEHLSFLARDLARAGIASLRYDAPGSGESDGTFEHDYRLTNFIQSVDAVLSWIDDLHACDGRVGLWGHSMGGFVALHTAVPQSARIRAACGSQPSHGHGHTSHMEAEKWRETGWETFSNTRFPEIHLPYEFYEDRTQYDLMTEIHNLQIPSLFIAGTRDEQVPAASVKQLFDAASEPKQYEEFNTNHFYKRAPAMLQRVNEVTVAFFQSALLR
jgi:pimeloyl-ACP methyl ester carboxylesterase